MEFNLRQELTIIFCEVDDFCQNFERQLAKIPLAVLEKKRLVAPDWT